MTRGTPGPGWTKLTLLAVMSLLVTATGCGEAGTRVIGEDPVIIVHDLEVRRLMDLGVRTISYDPGTKCLLLRSGDTEGGVLVPVWPQGVRPIIHDEKRGVEIRGLGRFLEGDTISIGGVVSQPDEVRRDLGIPCGFEHPFAMINAP